MKSLKNRWGSRGRAGSPPVKIGFIGGGNMGAALISALIRKKIFKATEIGVHEPDAARLKSLKKKFPVVAFSSNAALAEAASTIFLAVKPQQMGDVMNEIASFITPKKLTISIAAGLDTSYFQKRLPVGSRFVRAMPNMAAMIGEGAAGLFAASNATKADRGLALKIFKAAGQAVFVEQESLLDVVTAVSGSGPAFVYLFIDALIEAGAARGLDRKLGKALVLRTLVGAAKMVEASQEPTSILIERVASKGGTTEAGLKVLGERGFVDVVRATIDAATERAKELRCIS